MIDDRATREILGTDPAKPVTLVVVWTRKPDMSAIYALPELEDRISAATLAYDALKADVVGKLREFDSVTVRDLPGTGRVIVSAPSEVWRAIAPWIQVQDDIKVVANEVVGSVG